MNIPEPDPSIPETGRWVGGAYEPSREEIAAWCEHFQSTWSDGERWLRKRGGHLFGGSHHDHEEEFVQPHRWRSRPGNAAIIRQLEQSND